MFSKGKERMRAEVSQLARAKKLDAVILVAETAYEGLETRYPGIGVMLVGVVGVAGAKSIVSEANVHCTVHFVIADAEGNITTWSDASGMYGARIFDRNPARFSYNLAENLDPPRADLIRSAVIETCTGNLKRQMSKSNL